MMRLARPFSDAMDRTQLRLNEQQQGAAICFPLCKSNCCGANFDLKAGAGKRLAHQRFVRGVGEFAIDVASCLVLEGVVVAATIFVVPQRQPLLQSIRQVRPSF